MEYYPIYVNLRNKLVLVLGQYQILEFKIAKLLDAGADIRLVSKSLSKNIESYVKSNKIAYFNDEFYEKYLEDVWLVICGSDDTNLKTRVKCATQKQNIFCNFVDDISICSFIAPAVIEQGDITIAISTSGTSPALCKYLKNKIMNTIGDEYSKFADILGKIRNRVIINIPDQKKRSELFDSIVQDSKVQDLIRENNYSKAEKLIEEMIDDEINGQYKI